MNMLPNKQDTPQSNNGFEEEEKKRDFIAPPLEPEETFIKEDPDAWVAKILDQQDDDVVIEEYNLVNRFTEPKTPECLITPNQSFKKNQNDLITVEDVLEE